MAKRTIGWRIPAVLACFFALFAPPAWAGTWHFLGVIVEVHLDAKDKDGKPFPYCLVWSYNGDSEHGGPHWFRRVQLLDDNVWGYRYFLDGKPSTRAEAVRVGHGLHFNRTHSPGCWFEASSKPTPLPPPEKAYDLDADPENALWTFSLEGGVAFDRLDLGDAAKKWNEVALDEAFSRFDQGQRDGKRSPSRLGSDLLVDLPCQKGAFGDGFAIVHHTAIFNGTLPHAAVDASGLKIRERCVTGTLNVDLLERHWVRFLHPETGKTVPSIRVTISIDAKVEGGVIRGTFARAAGKDKGTGKLLGVMRKPIPLDGVRRAQLFLTENPLTRALHLAFLVKEGRGDPEEKVYLVYYGNESWPVAPGTSVELRDGRLKAELSFASGDGVSTSLALDGRQVGDLLFGTYVVTQGTRRYETRFTGRLQHPDEIYMDSWNWHYSADKKSKRDHRPPESGPRFTDSFSQRETSIYSATRPRLVVGGKPARVDGAWSWKPGLNP